MSALATPDQSSRESGIAFTVATGTMAVIGVWALVADRLVFPNRHVLPMTIPAILFGQVVVTAIFWGGTTFGMQTLDVKDTLGGGPRFIATFALVAWAGIGGSVLLDTRERFQLERAAVIDTALSYQVAQRQGAEVLSAAHEALHSRVQREMSAAREHFADQVALADSGAPATDWSGVSASLRRTASDVVRPLSGQLWGEVASDYPGLTLPRVVMNIVRYQPFRPLAVSALYLVASGARRIDELGVAQGTVRVSIVVAFIVVVMNAANRLMRRNPRYHVHIFVSTILAFQVFDALDAVVYVHQTGEPYTLQKALLDVAASVTIILLASGVGSVRLTSDKMLATFHGDLDERHVELLAQNREVGEVARAIATKLHGSVQTRLLSCAAAVDKASTEGNLVALNAALHEARLVLDSPLDPTADEIVGTVDDLVQAKCDLWAGLCAVDIALEPQMAKLSGRRAADFAAIVEEGLANAVRHGRASRVTIFGTFDGVTVRGVVRDDGIGLGGGSPNVGTSLYELLTEGQYSLTGSDDGPGAILTFTLRP